MATANTITFLEKIKNNPSLCRDFGKALKCYHTLFKEPLKEARWEEINEQLFKKNDIEVIGSASGSHIPGCDLKTNFGGISNKTILTKKGRMAISSFRLGRHCSALNVSTMDPIREAIHQKEANYDRYSILARTETKEEIEYIWYMIPKTFDILNPGSYTWSAKLGKRKDKKGKQLGWITAKLSGGSYMEIVFSMSSQLWIKDINIESLNEYKICGTKISKKKIGVIDFVDLHTIFKANGIIGEEEVITY